MRSSVLGNGAYLAGRERKEGSGSKLGTASPTNGGGMWTNASNFGAPTGQRGVRREAKLSDGRQSNGE